MRDALTNNRVEFVQLLLENGVCMPTFLTRRKLEDLYHTVSSLLTNALTSFRHPVERLSYLGFYLSAPKLYYEQKAEASVGFSLDLFLVQ